MSNPTKNQQPQLTTRAIDTSIAAVDAENRTLTVSFSSEQPYQRYDWWTEKQWIEIIGHATGEADLTRLNATAPVLYNHDRYDANNRIGVVQRAWIEAGKGYAEIKISARDEVAGIWRDIQDGVLTNISVGYQINERILTKQGDVDEYRVTAWTPMEISFVDIPADHTVGVGRSYEDNFLNQRGGDMPDPIKEKEADAMPPANVVDLDAVRSQAADDFKKREQKRRESIRSQLGAFADHHPEILQTCLDDMECTAERAGEIMLKKLGESMKPVSETRAQVTSDERDTFRSAVVDAMWSRAGKAKMDGQNDYRGYSLRELARLCLERGGAKTAGLSSMELVGRAFTQSESDFPVLLENLMHKSLANGYAVKEYTWRKFCAVGSVTDFRDHNRYYLGSFGTLEKVLEDGEFKTKAIPDGGKSTVSIDTVGNLFNITRQMIINDDLSSIVKMLDTMGQMAGRTIEKDVYALLAANPTLSDGYALFSTEHGNLAGTGTSTTMDAISAGRKAMANHKDISGNDYLDIMPSVWLGGLAYSDVVRGLNDSLYDPDSANKLHKPNVVKGVFSDIIENPRISGNVWYMFANSSDAPVIEVNFLDGNESPYMEVKQGFEVDGAQYKIRHDFGVDIIDYRGAYKNAGA